MEHVYICWACAAQLTEKSIKDNDGFCTNCDTGISEYLDNDEEVS